MAKETRDIKQHKIHTLIALVDVQVGTKVEGGEKKPVMRSDRVPYAIFDDEALVGDFMDKFPSKLKGQKDWAVTIDWVEYEPTAERFSLPFNPAPVVEDTEAQENGTN